MKRGSPGAPLLLALALGGCQPWAELGDPPPPCVRLRPEPGAFTVRLLECIALVPALGEGRVQTDLYLETNDYRAVIRHPLDALTLRDLGGGTILDFAPWGNADTVHEIVPIVGGGWLRDVEMALEDDGISFSGVVAPIPDLPPPVAAGERRTVRYSPDPDDPHLRVEGAEGFFIHPLGDTVLYGGVAQSVDRAVGAVGTVTDLGGAYVVDGTDEVLVATDDLVWANLEDETQRIAGTAVDAAFVALYDDGRPAGRVPVTPPSFTFQAPAGVDGVRAEAPGYAPSPIVAPSQGLTLPLGGHATLTLAPLWDDGLPHWSRVTWTAGNRAGSAVLDSAVDSAVLDPMGGTLALGAGVFDLVVSAGPAFAELPLHLELHDGDDVVLPVRLPAKILADTWALAGFRRPVDRSRSWRGSDLTATREAAADGLQYATFTAQDDVPALGSPIPGVPLLAVRAGVWLAGDGYTTASWPWAPSNREALHGAPKGGPRSPSDDAAILTGGPDDRNTLHVDLDWLDLAGPPYAVDPAPQLVALEAPGAALAAWEPWFRWLDASRPVVPTGPATWVAVDDPALLGLADVEQGLARGAVCAGTGPLVKLRVDGVGPGDDVPRRDTGGTGGTGDTGAHGATGGTGASTTGGSGGPPVLPPGTHAVTLSVGPLDGIDHLALVAADGQRVDLPRVPEQALVVTLAGPWVAAAAWSEGTGTDGEGPWAVTAPVWLSPPARDPP